MNRLLHMAKSSDGGAAPVSPQAETPRPSAAAAASTTAPAPSAEIIALSDENAALKKKIAAQESDIQSLLTERRKQNEGFASQYQTVLDENDALKTSNATLKATIENLNAAAAQAAADEKVIAEKMAQGLSRTQALAVIKKQQAYDASPIAKERAARVYGEKIETRIARASQLLAPSAARAR